jgi:hypothetical protein
MSLTSRSRRLSDRLSSTEDESPPQQSNLLIQSPQQSNLLIQDQLKECTVDITLLRPSETEGFLKDYNPDSGINEDEGTPPLKIAEKSSEKEEVPSKKAASKKESPKKLENEEETSPKKAAPKKVKIKEQQENVEEFKLPKSKKAHKKEGKENDHEKNLKRKKTTSESSEEGSIDEGGRAKRQKRKEVTYKEPSLNSKLRRPKGAKLT